MTQAIWLALFPAAVALAVERASYLWIWRHPRIFEGLCARRAMWLLGEPVEAVRRLFHVFKVIQAIVFVAWIGGFGGWFGSGPRALWTSEPIALVLGCLLIAGGQSLNFLVFKRLGTKGVFYGSRFGQDVPWVDDFPFSVLNHPQYVGTVASIWGLFLMTRFPHADWFVLPLLESVYYLLGAHFERDRPENADSALESAGRHGR